MPAPVAPTIAVRVPAGTTRSMSCSVHGEPLVVAEPDALEAHLAEQLAGPQLDGARAASTMSTGRSRYSKMRSKSASEASTSVPTESSCAIGKSRRVCSVVKATTVPIDDRARRVPKFWPATQ